MTEPKIENKNQRPTTISLLEARLARGESEAQKMVCRLANAMVRCGYTRDGIYNSRQAGYSGKDRPGVIIHWSNGKILLQRAPKKSRKGVVIETDGHGRPIYPEPVHPRDWTAPELIRVAQHLAPFLDSLENNVRWQIEELEKAVQTIESVLARVEADPRPSDEPAQMSTDPEVDVP